MSDSTKGTNQGYSIVVIYRSPNQTKEGIDYVYTLEGENDINGDLNLPNTDWETQKVGGGDRNKSQKNRAEQEELVEAFKHNNRIQFVTEPTRKTKKIAKHFRRNIDT